LDEIKVFTFTFSFIFCTSVASVLAQIQIGLANPVSKENCKAQSWHSDRLTIVVPFPFVNGKESCQKRFSKD